MFVRVCEKIVLDVQVIDLESNTSYGDQVTLSKTVERKDSKGREFSSSVSSLAGKGVEFRVCNNTLVTRNIDPSKLLMESKIVPSGVAEVAKLQAREGFVYLKP